MNLLKKNLLLVATLLVGFVLRIAAILADPFLHPWDERFHALVARNMITSPLVPILRVNPITDNYDKFMWCCNHVWVHKQPLFMWQMGLSMKVFGVSEWSMRLPSAIMGTLLILIIYRIAILINVKKQVALMVALLLACSNFHLQMIAGIHGMDHNDVAHGFYVLASIWALLEYQKSPKWYWMILVGVLAGAAILNKWLTGLLVYLVWAVLLLILMYKKHPVKKTNTLFYKFSNSVLHCFCTMAVIYSLSFSRFSSIRI
jgi:4-amino-4-deoxy-L-arabinose transferase-like glycosyltransferase